MSEFVVRMLPEVEPHTERFWTSGLDGALAVPRCRACGHHLIPPAPVCRRCRSTDLEDVELSGRGEVYTFTVNVQPWFPDMETPNVLAVVELAEEPGLRLLVTLVDVDPEAVTIGMPVRLAFAAADEVAIPYGVPA
ncbi:OB-fold domain-containing protein [Sporichthya brevicatena]|uniref:OB-fold domain-containing protein n=1 Tax=Sporichthya brevicatena TaxID=171442 RepID=A0ABP3RX42_9ACTN